ncbi:alkane 1-monooxygenase [Maribacter sp. HTCC2170]|uniref:alkane 1-monooxygenase n=1 Tax=Maribacter sp. (strain HTCC2170 / KCCM 42371) TaxID=313603 RepID=UPI00006BD357|nr:alkane 1-monooxygenase [Maribacter sp. HTCC2170]EAR02799.1 alkane-1 monooxygenase [Maribacter sp. HTCC2170]
MKDLKYLAAFTLPASALLSIQLLGYWSYFTPLYAFVIIPILEILLPLDTTNTTLEERKKKKHQQIFDWLLYLNIPVVYGLLIYALWLINSQSLSYLEIVGITISVGIVLGTNGINVAHELGHRNKTKERYLAKLLLLPSLYMHFYIEHNHGHHANAATKNDPATAKYNQSVYSFWFTSVIKQYINSWKIQQKLRKNNNTPLFSVRHDMLWYSIIQVTYLLLVFTFFNLNGLYFAIGTAIVGFLLLETVNYIEHYGLLRSKLPSGRYERVKEIHSWNSNHVVGRIVLYELTRHSDHHYKASKKYQILDYHDTSPQMPFGYPTSMVMSLIPPLWFKIMNPRVPDEMKFAKQH